MDIITTGKMTCSIWFVVEELQRGAECLITFHSVLPEMEMLVLGSLASSVEFTGFRLPPRQAKPLAWLQCLL
jgi:hypothetical protein